MISCVGTAGPISFSQAFLLNVNPCNLSLQLLIAAAVWPGHAGQAAYPSCLPTFWTIRHILTIKNFQCLLGIVVLKLQVPAFPEGLQLSGYAGSCSLPKLKSVITCQRCIKEYGWAVNTSAHVASTRLIKKEGSTRPSLTPLAMGCVNCPSVLHVMDLGYAYPSRHKTNLLTHANVVAWTNMRAHYEFCCGGPTVYIHTCQD